MNWFSQVIHRFSTASGPNANRLLIRELQHDIQVVRKGLAVLSREQQEHAEKTSKNLESYRARKQPRKDGKFAAEDPADALFNGSSMEDPTHEQIEAMARAGGLNR